MRLADRPTQTSTRSIHQHIHEDPYHWLTQPSDPRVAAHLLGEKARIEQAKARLQDLRSEVAAEFRRSVPEQEADLPVRRGDWWYYGHITNGQQYPCIRRIRATSDDELPPNPTDVPADQQQEVLDIGTLSPAGGYLGVGGFEFSNDGARVCYSIDKTGDENYTVHILDIETGFTFENEVINVGPGAVITPDGTQVFYSRRDTSWRCNAIWVHTVGQAQETDRLIYVEDDLRFHLSFRVSRSGQVLFIHSESRTTTEELALSLHDPSAQAQVIWDRTDGVKYTVEHLRVRDSDRFLVLHNTREQENLYVLTEVSVTNPSETSDWIRLISPTSNVQLLGIEAFAHMVALSFRSDSQDQIAIIKLGSTEPADVHSSASLNIADEARVAGYGSLHVVDLHDPLANVRSIANQSWNQDTLRLQVTSYSSPPSFIEYSPSSRVSQTLRRQVIPSHTTFDHYAHARVWATADDGTDIPISLVWNKDVVGDQPAPVVLYAYGAYGMSIPATFEPTRLSLLDRGVVCAIAHVRGGGELGPTWHAGGRMFTKRNTFTDLVACAEKLIADGRTEAKKIVIEGSSAGGLTVGAAANLAPQIFAGVIAEVPFVDPLNTLLDAAIPLTVTEWEEWGNPGASAEAYDYIRSYSPYDNIPESTALPRFLALTSMNDSRVSYAEAAKWIARLRDNGAEALLHVDESGGHARVSGRDAAHESGAFVFAWLLDTLERAERKDASARGGREE